MNVLFDVHYLYFWPHFAPIWDVLQAAVSDLTGFATYFSGEHPDAKPLTERVLQQAGLHVLSGEDEQSRLASLEAHSYDLAFVGGLKPGYQIIRRQTRFVCAMAHGLGRKQAYFTDAPLDADVRFTEGPQHTAALRDRFPDLPIELTGMSKLDPLFSSKLNLQVFRDRFQIDPAHPVILWAPTFYPSSLEVLSRSVAQLASRSEYQWIIKPHHFTLYPRQRRYKRQRRLLYRLAAKADNLQVLPPEEYSILPWLQAADLLLSDTSSTLFEMVALNKPVVQCKKYKKRWNHLLFPSRLYRKRLDTATTDPFQFAVTLTSAGGLETALETALRDPDWLQEGRAHTRAHLFHRLDGLASQRIVTRALAGLGGTE